MGVGMVPIPALGTIVAAGQQATATSDEVRAALSYKHLAYSSVTSRYKSLRDKGLIGYTGEKRKGNSSRPQQVMFARTPEYLYARKLWESKEDE